VRHRRHVRALSKLAAVVFGTALLGLSAVGSAAAASRVAVPASRVYGQDSYTLAAVAAHRAYPGWHGVSHVVIASGESAALAEAISASSLCWAYDAPLLLTSSTSLPPQTKLALAAIVSANPTVTVHVVGSTTTVPTARVSQIKSIVGSNTVEQPWPASNRYALAAGIARRVAAVAAAGGSTVPSAALVVNGTSGLWDALAAASVSRHTGIPIFYVTSAGVPAATASALLAAGGPRVIVVGGSKVVPPGVYSALAAQERWTGMNRFGTAAIVASRAVTNHWSQPATAAVAATQPGALAGAQLAGRQGGVALLTIRDRVQKTSWLWLAARSTGLKRAYVMGTGISDGQVAELASAPALPWLKANSTGKYVAKKARVTGWVGGNTTSVTFYAAGVRLRTVPVAPWGSFDVADLPMPSGSFTVRVAAGNSAGRTASASRKAKRLSYSPSTCIIIAKSKFKLFWIRRDRLVKIYPVAIGRASLETPAPATWKILQKYRTDPGGVSGPRKMRLFKKRGSSFVFSRYGIHGTNEPWVIGTKASHGCIRMYNRDVIDLYPRVPMGTMVYTRP